MKNLLFIAIAILGFSAVSFGQQGATTTATASATIVTPITVAKDVDLSFGNVAVSKTLGTVQLEASLAANRVRSGGVTLPAINGTVTAAKFTVSGTGGYLYTFTIPTSVTTTVSDGTNLMTVDHFTKSTAGTLSSGTPGTEVVYVGATLNVAANQAAGTYTSTNAGGTTFSVSVDYN